jgi:hypothetical protein
MPQSLPYRKTLIYIFFLLIFLTTMPGYFNVLDAIPPFRTAIELVEHGRLDLRIEDSHEKNLIGNLFEKEGIYTYSRSSDGKIYSKYGLGVTLCMIPFVLLGKALYMAFGKVSGLGIIVFYTFTVSAMSCFAAAGACLVMVLFANRMGFSNRISFILSIFLGIGTMLLFYANSAHSEALVTFETFAAAYMIFKFSRTGRAADIAWAGALAGLLLLTKASSVICVIVLACYAVYAAARRSDRAAIFWFLSPFFVFLLSIFWYNLMRFGNILETGYGNEVARLGGPRTPVMIIFKAFRHTFSAEKGFFVYNPILIASLFCLGEYFRKQKAMFLVTLAILLITFAGLTLTRFPLFEAWGPRYLLVMVPFLLLPVGYLLEKRKMSITVFVFLLFTASFLLNLTGTIIPHSEYRTMRNQFIQRTMWMQPDIEVVFKLLKNRLENKEEIYQSDYMKARDFAKKSESFVIDYSKNPACTGFSPWYLYLDRLKGIKAFKIFPFVTLPLALMICLYIFRSAKKMDSGVRNS